MRWIAIFLILFAFLAKGQNSDKVYRYENKGKLFVFWGWNYSAYSNSDIHFSGPDYDFTLYDVVATDRQSPYSIDFIDPRFITIPQYDFRIGYFINDKYSISIGNDHMKYVVKTGQTKKIDGYINNSGTRYDGQYQNEDIDIELDFLIYEHTDGLNYENLDLRRHERLKQFGEFTLDGFAGLGIGLLYPKTNATLFQGERYDDFNLAGYGANALAGLNMTFRGKFFMQFETKGGYMNMPNVRVSKDTRQGAKQSFYFFEYDLVFGVNIYLGKK